MQVVVWLLRHTWHTPKLMLRALWFLPRMTQIFSDCSTSRPDVVHLFWGHYPAVLGYMIGRWCPGIVLSHFLGAYDLVYDFEPSVLVANEADCLWTHAEANVALLRSRGIESPRLRVQMRGIDLRLLPTIGPKRPWQIVTVGRLVADKGMDRVLRMLAILREQFSDASLVLIGDGPEQPALRKLAAELRVDAAVAFRGNLPHAEVLAALGESSIFVLLSSSASERLPNALKEAMACECVCVVSRTPGIDELMRPLRHPMVVDPLDWREAAEQVRGVFLHPERYREERSAASEFIRRKLDARVAAEERVQIWESLIRDRLTTRSG